MDQLSFTFGWTDEHGCPTLVDPNLTTTIGYLSSNISMSVQAGSNWKIITPQAAEAIKIIERLEAIEKRLAILNIEDNPTHQMLDTLYKKYKMVEALANKDKDDE